MDQPLWTPSPQRIAASNLTAFTRFVHERYGVSVNASDYAELHAWSCNDREQFWQAIWQFCGVVGSTQGDTILIDRDRMPGARWFPEARLNFAENLLRRRDRSTAIVFWGEEQLKSRVSWGELYAEVSRLAQALRAQGVKPGDRVAAYLPNLPGAVIGMLATASIGAVWSSCSPDFGAQGVLDRFGQIEPKVLLAVDGYFHLGKSVDVLPRVKDIAAQLPSVVKVVVVPYTRAEPPLTGIKNAIDIRDFMAPFQASDIHFERLPFDHPLYILYSSGTTGVPKCIVHGAGGTLLQHLKEHQLHTDVKPRDRLFYYTTCGWMMWNWLVSGLASRATLMLYDGSPFVRRGRILWDYAEAENIALFGTAAKYIDAIAKLGLQPIVTHKLPKLKALLSTGSPLAPESFDYIYRNIKKDLHVASISGGTDIVSCFALGNPAAPVWRGEIQAPGLGLKVEVFDEDARSLRGEKGELVCTAPFPSMPLGFWNDADGSKYHAAYFDKYPNVWRHGDYLEYTEHGGLIIYGRSDAVLNPGGVRIGTAEIYRQVEKLDEVVESLAIGQDWPPQQPSDVRVILFVRLRDGLTLDDALTNKIKQQIRDNTTPRHVPDKVLQVADIPRTRSGKIVELAVRNVVLNLPVKNSEALANPEALELFRSRPELQT
ncbi:MAG: acetoacetate--CoA ligase [Burkholderiales bacterium]